MRSMDFFINNMYTSNEGKLRVRGFGLTSADASRLTKDADSNIQNSDEEKGRLFHHLMRYRKWDEAIEFIDRLALIDKAVAVNRKDRINVTTLMRAAVYGAPFTVIQRFCEIGGKALILARSDDGWTALHWACDRTNPNFQVVTYLVQNGGEKLVNKQDNRGRFALDLIRSDPTNENVRIFLQNFHDVAKGGKDNDGTLELSNSIMIEQDDVDPNIDFKKPQLNNDYITGLPPVFVRPQPNSPFKIDSSEPILVKQGNNPEIKMQVNKPLKREENNYEQLTHFSCAEEEVKKDIPSLSATPGRDNAEPIEERDMIATSDVWSMSTGDVNGGGKLEIKAISVKKLDMTITDDEVLKLVPGNFTMLKSGIENATITEEARDDGSVYFPTRLNIILRVPKKYCAFDVKASIRWVLTIDDGYPKLSTSPDDEHVKICTLQFAKGKKISSYPFHTELPSYCIVLSRTKAANKVSLEIPVKDIEVWLEAALTGLVSTVTPSAKRAPFDVSSTAETLKEDTSSGRQLLEDGNGLGCFAYKSSAIKEKSTLFVKGTELGKRVDGSKHRNPGKKEQECLNDCRHYENIPEFFKRYYPDKKETQKHSNVAALLQRKIKMMEKGCHDVIALYQAPESYGNGNGKEDTVLEPASVNQAPQINGNGSGLEVAPPTSVNQAPENNGHSNGQDAALRPAVNEPKAEKTAVNLEEELGKASAGLKGARLKCVIVCLVLVILAIVSIYDHHNVIHDNAPKGFRNEGKEENSVRPSLLLAEEEEIKRLQRLEPMKLSATAAFRVLLRALNGLSHCPPAFAQYCNSTGKQ